MLDGDEKSVRLPAGPAACKHPPRTAGYFGLSLAAG